MVSITNAVRPICLVVHVVLVCLFIRILIPGLIPLGPSVAESAIHHSDSSEAAVQAAPNAPPSPPHGAVPSQPRPSFHGPFIYACIISGRHHNQVITLAKAWAMAYRTNRSLIVPPFVQAPDAPQEPLVITPSSLRTIAFRTVYSWSDLERGPVRIIDQAEFFRDPDPKVMGSVACFKYSHCTTAPKGLRCTRVVQRMVGIPNRLLVTGSSLFRHTVSPAFGPPCFWDFLRPSALIAREVQKVQRQLPADYLAVHQRTFGDRPPCRAVLGWFWQKYHKQVPAANRSRDPPVAMTECEMPPEYVLQYRAEGQSSFFLGTDNYHPKHTQALLGVGAIRYTGTSLPAPTNVIGSMLVDTWVMVQARSFIGSPLSSLSWNVCKLRLGQGLGCGNLPNPDTGAPVCFLYPDVVG